jgi:hypothetical protein
LVLYLVRLLRAPAFVDGVHHKAVVWAYEHRPGGTSNGDRLSVGPNAGIHDRKVYGVRQEPNRLFENDRSVPYVMAKDVVVEVDDLEPWCYPEHHPVAHADELVLEPVVGQERDEVTLLHRNT